MSSTEFGNISFDLPKNQSNVIKVIGVGGGGSNAINHMFQQGIKGVDFVICNTDAQALENSLVPNKIQLGVSLTEGLGAGANPDIGEQAAVESFDDIKRMLDSNTKMVFITAGMGGGTGTGAAPIIAKQAKEMDILTVGIVTSPFQFEGKMRNEQAQLGVEKLRAHVDSLIVINNNKLREVYGNLGFKAGFSKADEVLATASRGIAEVITHHYTQNIDLRDAKTVLSNSGTAIMGSAQASGANRASEAISKALDSPLLNDNKITGAKNVLLLIVSGSEEITLDEIGEINDHIQDEAGHSANIIMGVGEDENLEEAISVTIIATGFDIEQQNEIVNTETKKIIHTLEDEQKAEQDLNPRAGAYTAPAPRPQEKKVVHTLSLDEEEDPAPRPKQASTQDESPKEASENEGPVAPKPQENLTSLDPTEEVRKMNVDYEEVKPEEGQDFIITDTNKSEGNEPDEADSDQQEQFTITFDFPKKEAEEARSSEERSPEKTQGEAPRPEEVPVRPDAPSGNVPSARSTSEESKREDRVVHPLSEEPQARRNQEKPRSMEASADATKRYSLQDYMEVEEKLNTSSSSDNLEEEAAGMVRKKLESDAPQQPSPSQDEDPFNNPIPEAVVQRAEERRAKMKAFNYKFRSNISKIDEIEKQPAYKRAGIELDSNTPGEEKLSRTTLGKDEDDELNFRRNNSFLHDNVD